MLLGDRAFGIYSAVDDAKRRFVYAFDVVSLLNTLERLREQAFKVFKDVIFGW